MHEAVSNTADAPSQMLPLCFLAVRVALPPATAVSFNNVQEAVSDAADWLSHLLRHSQGG